MKINIRGDKVEVTKAIKSYIEEKLGKLDKYFTNADEIKTSVIIRVKNDLQTIEVTVPTSKFTIRAEESNPNLYAAVDLIIDKLEREQKVLTSFVDLGTMEEYREQMPILKDTKKEYKILEK